MHWLEGHKKDVRAVAYTPDGRLVSGGSDRTVRLWAPISGKCLHTFKAVNVVYAVAASPDGKTAASAGRYPTVPYNEDDPYAATSNTVQLWNLETLQSITDLSWWMEFAPASIWSLAFSADGKYLAAASRVQSNSIIPDGGGGHWWRLGSELYGYFPEYNAYAVGFAHKGSAVAVTHKNTVTVYPKPGEKKRASYPIPAEWSPAVVFLTKDKLAIASSSYLYFADTTKPIRPKQLPENVRTGIRTITALAASPDGKLLLAGGKKAIECYDVPTRKLRVAYDFKMGIIHSLAFAPDGCTFAVAGAKGLLVCDVE